MIWILQSISKSMFRIGNSFRSVGFRGTWSMRLFEEKKLKSEEEEKKLFLLGATQWTTRKTLRGRTISQFHCPNFDCWLLPFVFLSIFVSVNLSKPVNILIQLKFYFEFLNFYLHFIGRQLTFSGVWLPIIGNKKLPVFGCLCADFQYF